MSDDHDDHVVWLNNPHTKKVATSIAKMRQRALELLLADAAKSSDPAVRGGYMRYWELDYHHKLMTEVPREVDADGRNRRD
jgi:hypothetical protein